MRAQLEGLWQPVYAEHDGEEVPKIMLEKMEVELAGSAISPSIYGSEPNAN